MSTKTSNQCRLKVWSTFQQKTRAVLHLNQNNGKFNDGEVGGAIEQAVMQRLNVQPESIWEAECDGWLLSPIVRPNVTEDAAKDIALPYPRRVEIKSRRYGACGKRISVNLALCDDLVFVRWKPVAVLHQKEIVGDIWYVADICNAFRQRPIGKTKFGTAQIEKCGVPVGKFKFC